MRIWTTQSLRRRSQQPWADMIKRVFDIFFSAAALIAIAPVMVIVACAIWVNMGRPVIFAQNRPGLGGRVFKMRKFRTMRAPALQPASDDAARITPLGHWLRRTSLDEIPALWNVFTGDMSIVGPRPLLVDYLPLYSAEQARRHAVKPGITGWAQVNGRNAINWDRKFALDVWYIDNHSTRLDLRIIWMTIIRVFRREGIDHGQDVTMPRFEGSDSKPAAPER
jgi:sugar transferase EpsL